MQTGVRDAHPWSWITESPLVGQAPSWVCMWWYLNLAIDGNEVGRSNRASDIHWEHRYSLGAGGQIPALSSQTLSTHKIKILIEHEDTKNGQTYHQWHHPGCQENVSRFLQNIPWRFHDSVRSKSLLHFYLKHEIHNSLQLSDSVYGHGKSVQDCNFTLEKAPNRLRTSVRKELGQPNDMRHGTWDTRYGTQQQPGPLFKICKQLESVNNKKINLVKGKWK